MTVRGIVLPEDPIQEGGELTELIREVVETLCGPMVEPFFDERLGGDPSEGVKVSLFQLGYVLLNFKQILESLECGEDLLGAVRDLLARIEEFLRLDHLLDREPTADTDPNDAITSFIANGKPSFEQAFRMFHGEPKGSNRE